MVLGSSEHQWLTDAQRGYVALGVFAAFGVLPLRSFFALALLLGGAYFSNPHPWTFPRDGAWSYIERQMKAAQDSEDADQPKKTTSRFGRIFNRVRTQAQLAVLRSQVRFIFNDYVFFKLVEITSGDEGFDGLVYLGIFGQWINTDALLRRIFSDS